MKQIAHYKIRHKLGTGNMAVVYRAYDPHHNIDVALKVLHSHLITRQDIVQRFTREAKTAAALHHPHIIQVHDFGQDGAHHYRSRIDLGKHYL